MHNHLIQLAKWCASARSKTAFHVQFTTLVMMCLACCVATSLSYVCSAPDMERWALSSDASWLQRRCQQVTQCHDLTFAFYRDMITCHLKKALQTDCDFKLKTRHAACSMLTLVERFKSCSSLFNDIRPYTHLAGHIKHLPGFSFHRSVLVKHGNVS